MRVKIPDYKDAESILDESERQMAFTLTLPTSDTSAFTVVRNIYECFRMLGDAILVSQGIESDDHVAPINALLKLEVNTSRPTSAIDNLRRLRRKINYYGYHPTKAEADDSVDLAKSCFPSLLGAVKKEIADKR